MTTDPVCGMQVDESSASHQSEYQGKNHYFCSASCKTQFDRNPQRYAGGEQQQRGPQPEQQRARGQRKAS